MTSVGALPPGWVEPPRGEDLPYDDGEPLESLRHRHQMNLLIETLEYAWRDRDVFIAGNMFIYFSSVQARNNHFRGPDFFVVNNVPRGERKSWVVWEEAGRTPDVVVELLSESTAAVDRGEKKQIYAEVLRVPEYILFDPWTKSLEAFRLEGGAYVPVEPAHGRIPSRELGLTWGSWEGEYLGITTSWLRLYDPSGSLLPTPAEAERANAEAERAKAEAERANAEAERASAEAERATAAAERANAEAERVRADRLEALLRSHGIDPSGGE